MSDSDDCGIDQTPPDIREKACIASSSILPEKSKEKYMAVYEQFIDWKLEHQAVSFSENVLMAYFLELSKKYQASTMWSKYSMLKTMIKTKNDIDIKNYTKLTAFLKRKSEGYQTKKSKVLTADNIEKCINEAPDQQYLATKVALIFGISGACRREELANITIQDIENHGNMIIVKIPNTKNKIPRSFTVDGPFYEIVRKYHSQRTSKGKSDRFFQNFQKGKCTAQAIGINKFGNMPKEIANFLNLPDANLYTGHSFRRSSATLLADSGANMTTLKRHGGWKSTNVAEGYIENSIDNKRKIGNQITQSIHIQPPIKQSQTKQHSSTFYENHEPQPGPSPAYDNICEPEPGPSNSEGRRRCYTPTNRQEHEPESTQTCEINSSLSQTVNLPAKTFNVTLNNCSNCTLNFYQTKK